MLSRNDWRGAYEHLIQRLQEMEVDASLILEIRDAASRRREISEDDFIASDHFVENGASIKKELGGLRFRPPTPKEAFESAIEVLDARLRELPAAVSKLSERLDRKAADIRWEPDASEADFFASQESFGAEEMTVNEVERSQLASALDVIKSIIANPEDDGES